MTTDPTDPYVDAETWAAAVPGPFRSDPAFTYQPIDAAQPAVLLIGDSISMGYTPTVRERLASSHRVLRVPDNAASTARTLESIGSWLAGRRWRAIHANWGLHDLRRIDALTGEPAWGQELVPLDAYRVNLERLAEQLRSVSDLVILATTTPVPPGADWRVAGDEARYNKVLRDVAAHHALPVDDLWSVATGLGSDQRMDANVHYPSEGYRALGDAVADALQSRLVGDVGP